MHHPQYLQLVACIMENKSDMMKQVHSHTGRVRDSFKEQMKGMQATRKPVCMAALTSKALPKAKR
ncbi:hypothetical protein HNP33_000331 [Comamonas odontotermitis]|uniref:Uncharacterized protein n=1 Tax=Comamonas odontotermitis TaxID=379895 RepID=A0ABR6RAW4_9BURK|nr:hypothetical protein [Comamonas odontotermitis]